MGRTDKLKCVSDYALYENKNTEMKSELKTSTTNKFYTSLYNNRKLLAELIKPLFLLHRFLILQIYYYY
jgi:hypothetical protein